MSRMVMHIGPAPGRRFITGWRACFLLLAILTQPALVAADVATDWNIVVADLVGPRFGGPQQ